MKGDIKRVDISHHSYGDQYVQVLGQGVSRLNMLSHFYMKGNRIGELGAVSFFSSITQNVRVIDLASNSIGNLGCQHLAQVIARRDCK